MAILCRYCASRDSGVLLGLGSSFYRDDGVLIIKGWLAYRRNLPDATISDMESSATTPLSTVMGAVSENAYDHSEPESIASDELIFLEDENTIPESFAPLLEHAVPADSMLIGSVADLLHEIKTLFKMLQEHNSSKEEGVFTPSIFTDQISAFSRIQFQGFNH